VTALDRRPLLIGLTGPIGCGKSTVAAWLAEQGGGVIDADRVARDVTAPGEPGHDLVLAHFGDEFRRPDGTLDRAALGRRVFADPDALMELERIVHPIVRPRILAAIDAARDEGARFVVVEAIKLLEAGYGSICDEVWLVTCPAAEQRQRLEGRGLSAADAAQRIQAQAGFTERVAGAATRILDTGGSLDQAHRLVLAALAAAEGRAAAQRER
jgi:dephospho-CoA kinase